MDKLNNIISSKKLSSMLIKVSIVLVLGVVLFIVGAFTALAPQFVARLILFPVLLLLVVFALLSFSNNDLKHETLKAWLAILLATMALWPTYMLLKVGALPSLDARRVVAGLTVGAMVYLVLARKPVRDALSQFFTGPLRVGFILISAYVLLRMASSFMAQAPTFSLMQVFWESLYYYAMFFVGALFFNRQFLQTWAIKVVLYLALVIFIYALFERGVGNNLLVNFAPSNDEFLMFKKALAASRERDGSYRVQGTFEHPLLLAEFAAIAASFSLSSIFWGQAGSLRWLSILVLLLSAVAGVLTGARSALISFGVVVTVITFVKLFSVKESENVNSTFFRKFYFWVSLFAVFLVALPFIQLLISGADAGEAGSTNARIFMLVQGWESIKSNFLIGVGPGTAASVAGVVTTEGLGTLDNYLLAIAIESGMPALVLLVLFLVYPAYKSFNILMRSQRGTNKVFTASLLGTILALLITHAILWMPYNLFFGFLFVGMFLSAQNNLESQK